MLSWLGPRTPYLWTWTLWVSVPTECGDVVMELVVLIYALVYVGLLGTFGRDDLKPRRLACNLTPCALFCIPKGSIGTMIVDTLTPKS